VRTEFRVDGIGVLEAGRTPASVDQPTVAGIAPAQGGPAIGTGGIAGNPREHECRGRVESAGRSDARLRRTRGAVGGHVASGSDSGRCGNSVGSGCCQSCGGTCRGTGAAAEARGPATADV
jgi:hypothetical protein